MAKAIKIDPECKTIEEIEIASADEIRSTVGGRFNIEKTGRRGEFVYFDDMAHAKDGLARFTIGNLALAGPVLVLGLGMKDARSSVADVAALVSFPSA